MPVSQTTSSLLAAASCRDGNPPVFLAQSGFKGITRHGGFPTGSYDLTMDGTSQISPNEVAVSITVIRRPNFSDDTLMYAPVYFISNPDPSDGSRTLEVYIYLYDGVNPPELSNANFSVIIEKFTL